MIINNNKELKLLGKAAADCQKGAIRRGKKTDKFPFGPFFDSVLEKAYSLDFFTPYCLKTGGSVRASALCVLLENICREDSSLGGIILTTCAAHEILLAAGNDELLKKLTEKRTRQ
ncbi:MAG: hypothetical protein R2875_08140 [Desulfobacterales bacterium]